MNVLMLGWEFPPFFKGGLGPATVDLATEVARRGHKLTFALPYKLPVSSPDFNIVFAGDKPEFSDEYYMGYSSVDILRSEDLSVEEKVSKIRSLYDEVRLYVQRMKKLVKEIDYDIVHAHDWLTMPAGVSAKQSGKKPLVSHVHATEFYRSGGRRGNEIVSFIEYQSLHVSDKVVCISNHVKNVVKHDYRIPESKLAVVHNGVKWTAWNIDYEKVAKLKKRHKVVLSLGRLTIQKGVDYLLQAAKLVIEKDPSVLFVIIGEGDMQKQLMDYTVENNMMKNVIFTGWLDHSGSAPFYAAADLFVMPSVAEPFGLVAIEAALLDTPVIISKTSGCGDVFNHCLKIDFWDTSLLASHIYSILNHRGLSYEMIQNGKRNAKEITWAKTAQNVENIYKELI